MFDPVEGVNYVREVAPEVLGRLNVNAETRSCGDGYLPELFQHISGDLFNLGIALAQTVRPVG